MDIYNSFATAGIMARSSLRDPPKSAISQTMSTSSPFSAAVHETPAKYRSEPRTMRKRVLQLEELVEITHNSLVNLHRSKLIHSIPLILHSVPDRTIR